MQVLSCASHLKSINPNRGTTSDGSNNILFSVNTNPFRTSSCPATLGQIDRGTSAAHQVQVMLGQILMFVCNFICAVEVVVLLSLTQKYSM